MTLGDAYFIGKELGWKCDYCDNIAKTKEDLYEQGKGQYDGEHYHYCINCHIASLEHELSRIKPLIAEIARLKAIIEER